MRKKIYKKNTFNYLSKMRDEKNTKMFVIVLLMLIVLTLLHSIMLIEGRKPET